MGLLGVPLGLAILMWLSRSSPETNLTEFPYADCVSRRGLEMTFHGPHRPLEGYSRALEGAGLVIDAIREHPVPQSLAARSVRSRRWHRVPLFLQLRARKLWQR